MNLVELRASDLRQHAYCPRVAWYKHVLPGAGPPETAKMAFGRTEEERVARLELRRKLRRFRLAEGTRRFAVWLECRSLGVAGICDLVVDSPAGLFPVDFKMTEGGVAPGHKLQLVAYALALEEQTGRAVERGFIYLLPIEDVVVVELGRALREQALDACTSIRAALDMEELPAPTQLRSKCVQCEFRNLCNDVT